MYVIISGVFLCMYMYILYVCMLNIYIFAYLYMVMIICFSIEIIFSVACVRKRILSVQYWYFYIMISLYKAILWLYISIFEGTSKVMFSNVKIRVQTHILCVKHHNILSSIRLYWMYKRAGSHLRYLALRQKRGPRSFVCEHVFGPPPWVENDPRRSRTWHTRAREHVVVSANGHAIFHN